MPLWQGYLVNTIAWTDDADIDNSWYHLIAHSLIRKLMRKLIIIRETFRSKGSSPLTTYILLIVDLWIDHNYVDLLLIVDLEIVYNFISYLSLANPASRSWELMFVEGDFQRVIENSWCWHLTVCQACELGSYIFRLQVLPCNLSVILRYCSSYRYVAWCGRGNYWNRLTETWFSVSY